MSTARDYRVGAAEGRIVMNTIARAKFHRRHNPEIVEEGGGAVRWTCTCGARGQQEPVRWRAWRGYYAHVNRAAKKEGY